MKTITLIKQSSRRNQTVCFWRRFLYLVVLGMMFVPTLKVQSSSLEKNISAPSIAEENNDYWKLVGNDTSEKWAGDNFHGQKSEYKPIFDGDTIGADYTQFWKDKVDSNLHGTCAWKWDNGAVPLQVVPGTNYTFTLSVDAEGTGNGFVGATVNGYVQNGEGNSTIAMLQAYLDIGGQGKRTDHQEAAKSLTMSAGKNYGEKRALTLMCQIDIVEVKQLYFYEWSKADCIATLKLPEGMESGKEFTPLATVLNNQKQPVQPQKETWYYNDDSTVPPIMWNGKAGTVKYEYVCPQETFPRRVEINIPPPLACSASITLPLIMEPKKQFFPKAVVVDNNNKPVKPENESWYYNGKSSAQSMVWNGKAATVEYQFTCPQDQQPGKAKIIIPAREACKAPYDGSPQDKFDEIIRLYKLSIKKGEYRSGSINNLMADLGNDNLNQFKCGGYQGEILDFLLAIKFNSDACVAGLLDEWDFGPIEVLGGGHQAVVLYPHDQVWQNSGASWVLDPWLTQKPEAYPLHAWKTIWHGAGINPSTAGYPPDYPTHNGTYVKPGMKPLSDAENKYILSLPTDQADLFKKLNPSKKREFLDRHQDLIKKGNMFSAFSPLAAYVIDAKGKKTGMVNGTQMQEIEGVYFSSFPLKDGTFFSQIEYAPGQTYTLVLQGTGNGEAHIMSSYISLKDEFAVPQSYIYQFTAVDGQEYKLGQKPGADLTSKSGTVKAKVMDASDEKTILAMPDIDISGVNIPEKPVPAGSDTVDNSSLFWGLGAGSVCLCGGGILVLAIGGMLYSRRKTRT